jgi:hypothetical protein
LVACEGSHRSNHKHGVEPNFTLNFWASGDSSLDSEDKDDLSESDTDSSSRMLVAKALKVGFSLDQNKQAGNELESPSSSASKVYSNLKQGSISKRIVDVLIKNHKGKVKPGEGPLPSPRQLPLCTFGGVLAKAQIVERPNEDKRANSLRCS